MAAITKIEFWKDVGFLEGAIEIPRLDAPDPVNPDLTIEPDQPIIPSRERFFTKLKIKEYYDELMEMSYIRLTYELNDKTMIFYGWVRDISLESDGDLPMTVIDWHIDEWRTWKSSITLGSGHVKRRPFRDLATTPIQNYQYRFLELPSDDAATKIDLMGWSLNGSSNEGHVWWVLIFYSTGGSTSFIELYYYPVFTKYSPVPCWFKGADPNPIDVRGPTIRDIYEGQLDEFFDFNPQNIIGVWLSPIPPDKNVSSTPSGVGSTGSPYDFGTTLLVKKSANHPDYACIQGSKLPYKRASFTKTFNSVMSNERERYIVTDPDGYKIMDIPYGMSVDNVESTVFLEPDSPYIEITFRDGSLGNVEGMTVNYPLMCLPVNSNAWSSYVYSGQREYDKEMRTVQSNANAWKNTATGAGQGAMMGAFGAQGLALGMVGGAAGGLISYGVEMLYQNDEEQRLEDRLAANQPTGMIFSGGALKGAHRSYGIELHRLVMDSYSGNQLVATRNQFGISVDELMTSCDTLIRTTSPTGYYNIQNLIVGGDAPVSAKRWIREKFKTGVRLI